MSNRRKSLIPKPSLSSLRSTTSLSSRTTPTNSPTKSNKSIDLSPSKIPLSKSNNSLNNLTRKRSISNSLNDYLSNLQSHISNDLEIEKSSLSLILLELDDRLSNYHKLCKNLRDLQKIENKLNNSIFEYEIGIPVKNSLFQQENLKIENELNLINEKLDIEKEQYIKKNQYKEDKLINTLKELVNDAKIDDNETINLRNERLKILNFEKEKLLSMIEIAKSNLDNEIIKLKDKFKFENETIKLNFNKIENNLSLNLKKLKSEFNQLNNEKIILDSKINNSNLQINKLNSEIELKSSKINELNYRLEDIKSLIKDLQLDLTNTQTLCSNFENGEYKSTKNAWILSKSRLIEETHKRLKIEIQIRELSGIPNIIILDNNNNSSDNNKLKSSKLNEFFKPYNYDWKSEILTALEATLEGVPSCIINLGDQYNFKSEIKNYLENILKSQDRFNNFETEFKEFNNENSINNFIKQKKNLELEVT
ncbi:hypothetical protein C6P42_003792 [Pichia californica]|nr:hypothetical protein C6P42_003792 [[Candida] californica]